MRDLDAKFKTILGNTIGHKNVESKQEIVTKWWKTIQDAYAEPQRHYHTIEHINSMWALLDSVPQEDIDDKNVVGFAIFFHE
jgi:predicted metal-dependent HD superfamily phosphohydrolase